MKNLKEATSEKHSLAEKMPFNQKMIKGELNKKQYFNYLIQLRQIYSTIELHTLPNPNLNRLSPIQIDIEELKNSIGIINIDSVLSSTNNYVKHLTNLNSEQILAHVYLNYLAIIYGGQMIKRQVPSAGKLYDFENMQEAVSSIRVLQKDEWADEVNLGFDFMIEIFKELDKLEA